MATSQGKESLDDMALSTGKNRLRLKNQKKVPYPVKINWLSQMNLYLINILLVKLNNKRFAYFNHNFFVRVVLTK